MKTTLTTLLLLITLTTFSQTVRSNYNETFNSRTFKYEYNEERVTFKIDLEYKEVLINYENSYLFLEIQSFDSPTSMTCIDIETDCYYVISIKESAKELSVYNSCVDGILTTYLLNL
jgi:hypothetical protein